MLRKYSESIVSKHSSTYLTVVRENYQSMMEGSTVISGEDKVFLVSSLSRKIPASYKKPIYSFNNEEVLCFFDPEIKSLLPLVIPAMKNGDLITGVNLYPHFKNVSDIGNMALLYKLITDAYIQKEMYSNWEKFRNNSSFVKITVDLYEQVFNLVFKNNLNYHEGNVKGQAYLAFVSRLYAANYLLGKSGQQSINIAFNSDLIKLNFSLEEVLGYTGSDSPTINSFSDFLDLCEKSEGALGIDFKRNITDERDLIKKFIVTFPTMMFGIDMVQVMMGGSFAYMQSKFFNRDFFLLNKVIFQDKKFITQFNNVMKGF